MEQHRLEYWCKEAARLRRDCIAAKDPAEKRRLAGRLQYAENEYRLGVSGRK